MANEVSSKSPSGALLKGPLNSTTKRIFVAGTRMNEGKTTTCLGLFSALQSVHPKVGYIKPVGQRFVEIGGSMIDEDSVLFDRTYEIATPIEAMSPVAIDPTLTRRYLDDPDSYSPELVDRISRGFDRAAYEKDYIIIEGSGHAGVGSVIDMSNASVAKLLGAKVIIVSSGGIGRPVDEIATNRALFREHGVEVIGAILNKVFPDKLEFIREYGRKGLARLGIDLLGVIPVVKELTAPNLAQIVEEIGGRWLNGEPTGRNTRVLRVVIGAMTARVALEYFKPGVLVIVPGDREDILFAAMASERMLENAGSVAGIILTRNVLPSPRMMDLIRQTSLPVVISEDESYGVASKINGMTIKTQPEDCDKIPLIQKTIMENIDLERILQAFDAD
ncbi:MAG: AAA family ATPase [Opitutales bacterium]|nr:AAA family ATPase [Opitutales bacterium]